MRVGQGFDVHGFTDGDSLLVGGVRIPFEHGIAAHSDGDVLLHAIADAVLGAAGEGDIGRHFPDTDASLRGIDSRILLREVVARAAVKGWRIENVDATVIAQRPKLAPHIPQMRGFIASDLGVAVEAVNVKATTTEHLGFTGRGEGIAAMAVVLLLKANAGG